MRFMRTIINSKAQVPWFSVLLLEKYAMMTDFSAGYGLIMVTVLHHMSMFPLCSNVQCNRPAQKRENAKFFAQNQ